MRIALLGLAALFSATGTAPALAQAGEEAAMPEITVVGREQREKQVKDFVRALTIGATGDPAARFDYSAVCPGVVGLTPAKNDEIAGRMRAVARAGGLPVSDQPDCRPNALVILTADPEVMIDALRATHPIYFTDPGGQPVEPPKQTGPAIAWHLEGRVDRSGTPVGFDREQQRYTVSTITTPSHISNTIRPVMLAGVVVIKLDAIVGLSPVQIADYAAMRLYTRSKPQLIKDAGTPTILTILDAADDAEVPVTLTQWDLDYLKAFYRAAPFREAGSQRAETARAMRKSLDDAATPE